MITTKVSEFTEKVYSLAMTEDRRIQLELDYAMMIKVAKTCIEAHHE